jgi:hypothetical protein
MVRVLVVFEFAGGKGSNGLLLTFKVLGILQIIILSISSSALLGSFVCSLLARWQPVLIAMSYHRSLQSLMLSYSASSYIAATFPHSVGLLSAAEKHAPQYIFTRDRMYLFCRIAL